VGDGVVVRDAMVVVGVRVGRAPGVVDVVGVDRAAVEVCADDVAASLAAGEPALQPARARARQVRVLVAAVALAVLLRCTVRSLLQAPGDPSLPWSPRTDQSSRSVRGFFGLVLWTAKVG